MDKIDKDTKTQGCLGDTFNDVFGSDFTQSVRRNRELSNGKTSDGHITINFNPTINLTSSNSNVSDETQNNPPLSEVGKFAAGLAGILSMFVK